MCLSYRGCSSYSRLELIWNKCLCPGFMHSWSSGVWLTTKWMQRAGLSLWDLHPPLTSTYSLTRHLGWPPCNTNRYRFVVLLLRKALSTDKFKTQFLSCETSSDKLLLISAGVSFTAHVVFPRKEQRETFRLPKLWSAYWHLRQETP